MEVPRNPLDWGRVISVMLVRDGRNLPARVPTTNRLRDRAKRILAERYARSELDTLEYHRLLDTLHNQQPDVA